MIAAKNLGRRIKIRRTVLDMTQQELAQALGISQGYVSYLERGERPIDAETLDHMAAALQCRPEDLLNEKRRLA